eukprot:4698240-Prymnesium_polylepis.1
MWRGAAIEANPNTFAKLKDNYRPFPEISTLNLAVSNRSGEIDLWCPRGRGARMGVTSEACTTVRHWAMTHWKERYHYTTPVVTLASLWARLQPRVVDLLVIDVEGAENSILTEPLPDPKPRLLYFESLSFSIDAFFGTGDGSAARAQARVHALLTQQGYKQITDHHSVVHGSHQSASRPGGDELWRHVDGMPNGPSVAATESATVLFQFHNSTSPCRGAKT